MSKRCIGYVTNFYPEKGYGFIKNKNGGNCYFIHISQVVSGDYLNKGDVVEFSIGYNKRVDKEQATSVIVMYTVNNRYRVNRTNS